MGLDGVELLMAVEETFDISIADEEAATVITVGDLQSLVLSKVEAVANAPCLTAHVFYRMRRALMELYEVPRMELAPALPLTPLIPMEHRRAHWDSLGGSMNLTLPALRRPRALVWAINLSLLFFMISAFLAGQFGALSLWMTLAFLVAGAVLWWLAYRVTRPFAVHFPNLRTLGDLARATLHNNTSTLAATRQTWSAPLVWEVLCGLIIEKIGVDFDEITPDARIVDDLGIE